MKTTVQIEWKDLKFGSKDTTISLIIRGNPSDEQILMLTKLKAAGTGFATLSSAQMDIDDYIEENHVEHEGVEYTVNPDGTVDVDPNQVTIEEAAAAEADNVTDLETERKRRGRRKKVEEPAPEPDPIDGDDLLPAITEDELPF